MEFNGLERRSAQLLKLIVEREMYQVYFPKPAKSLFISQSPEHKEVEKREFVTEVIELNILGGSWYLGEYHVQQEELEAWVKPQVYAWDH